MKQTLGDKKTLMSFVRTVPHPVEGVDAALQERHALRSFTALRIIGRPGGRDCLELRSCAPQHAPQIRPTSFHRARRTPAGTTAIMEQR